MAAAVFKTSRLEYMLTVSCILHRVIRVRRFEEGDLQDILAIERDSFGEDAWSKRLLAGYLRKYPELFLVARVGRTTLGYSITCAGVRTAELVSIAVDLKARSQGIARALLNFSLKDLRGRKVKSWWLMVEVNNTAAIRFYEKFGFITTKKVKGYYGAGRDAWRMRLLT
jgi:[ribosomal protein S18]-alanine N-acetyltransferase